MSHVELVQIEIKDLESLAKAAEQCGLIFHRDQKTYKWFGRHMGDYPVPKGFTKNDLGKCEHSLSQPKGGYEVGVVKNPNGEGYTLLWDFWQGGFGLREKIGEGGNKLKQEYAIAVATKQARRQGLRVTRQTRADGKVRLVAR